MRKHLASAQKVADEELISMPNSAREENSSLTPKQKWNSIPQEIRNTIIRNAWCIHCSGGVEILDYRLYSAGPDIVLRGRCSNCGGKVARVVEK